MKNNFGKWYHKKPITPFQKFWNGGVGKMTLAAITVSVA